MKHIFKLTALMAITLQMVFLSGCKKEYGPDKIPNFPVMDGAPVPKFALDPAGDLVIQQPEEFKSKFTLDLYFPDDLKTAPLGTLEHYAAPSPALRSQCRNRRSR